MKLIKLEILNLASLDKATGEVINFEEGSLGDTSIFSIVGPTGSGKSTILDAICLALYNRAPRYPLKKNSRGQKIEIYGMQDEAEKNRLAPTDGRNILTRGKKEGYTKLTFFTNANVYRAEWHVRFHVKNYAPVTTSLFRIEQKDGKYEEIVCPWEDLPKIIGLDYDQFLRTVLIAQGSFANFLVAEEDQRFELLEKLIGSKELYSDIAAKIKEKRDAALERYNIITTKVETYRQNILNEENFTALNDQISRLEKEEKLLNEQIKALEKSLEWYATEAKCLEEIKKQTESVTSAMQALEAIKADIDRLSLHDALVPAMDFLREERRLDSEIKNDSETIGHTKTEIAKQKDSIDASKKDLESLAQSAKDALDAIEKAKPHIQKARELKTRINTDIEKVKEKESALASAKKEAEKADTALKQNIEDINRAQKQKSDAETDYNALKESIEKKLKSLQAKEDEEKNKLAAAQSKIEGISGEALTEAKEKAAENLKDIDDAIEIVARIKAMTEDSQNNDKRQKDLTADNEDCEAKIKSLNIAKLKAEVETLQSTYTLMTSENWKTHRSNLKEGDPCPLCGSKHHPYAKEPDNLEETTSSLSALLEEKKRELDKQQAAEKTLTDRINQNKGELNALVTAMPGITKDLEKQGEKWTVIASKHPEWDKDKTALETLKPDLEKAKQASDKAWNDFRAVELSIQALVKSKDLAANARDEFEKQSQEKLKKAEAKITKANTTLESSKAQTDNLTQQLQEKTSNQESAAKAFDEANKSLAQLQQQYDAELGGKNPDEVEKQLDKDHNDADKAVNDKKDEISKLQASLSESEGSLKTLNDKMNAAKESMQAKSEELNLWIDEFNSHSDLHIDKTVVAEMLDAKDDWESIKRIKDAREKDLTSAQALKSKAEKDMAEHLKSKPDKSMEELKFEKETLEQNSKRKELEDARLILMRHNDAVRDLGDQMDELNTATADNDDWKEINDSIGGGEGKLLRKIAQCYTLRFLVEHANDEIRKFNSRYELQQVQNSLGIRVIDHDRADDVRDTTSLSGGETFIVSLGLALGLSSLSSRSISFDNLFIDEGFGTLDPDTLATVIDSLAMLQTSKQKKVGVISHTDTMSERITTQIRIIKNGNSGSSHIEIYP